MSVDIGPLLQLPVSERLEIIEQLWDSIASNEKTIPVPQWQKEELAQRKARFVENPDRASDWEEALHRLRGRHE